MNTQWKYLVTIVGLLAIGACTSHQSGEVVESAYLEPLFPEPKYVFVRNGSSSVDTQECEFLHTPLDYVYESGLRKALMGPDFTYHYILGYYRDGDLGMSPRAEIARSTFVRDFKDEILAYIDGLIETSARIGGRGAEDQVMHRRQEARAGQTGYVGKHIGDDDIYFVDEQGFVTADIFKYAMMAAVYLDKVLNIHLDKATLSDVAMQKKHEALEMQPGHNYTALEHHWDLGYGYYGFWRPLAQAEGIQVLRDSEDRIFRAFVEGRTVMETFRYDDMAAQAQIIRDELARVVIIRAMHLLVGENTLKNLEERPRYAFRFLSQAYGLIYAVQFLRRSSGEPYMTRTEVQGLLDDMRMGEGLWDSTRLLASVDTRGSLTNIAHRLGQLIGVSPQDIKK